MRYKKKENLLLDKKIHHITKKTLTEKTIINFFFQS